MAELNRTGKQINAQIIFSISLPPLKSCLENPGEGYIKSYGTRAWYSPAITLARKRFFGRFSAARLAEAGVCISIHRLL
jgi:hypothetical protein